MLTMLMMSLCCSLKSCSLQRLAWSSCSCLLWVGGWSFGEVLCLVFSVMRGHGYSVRGEPGGDVSVSVVGATQQGRRVTHIIAVSAISVAHKNPISAHKQSHIPQGTRDLALTDSRPLTLSDITPHPYLPHTFSESPSY